MTRTDRGLWLTRAGILALGVLAKLSFLTFFPVAPLDPADLCYWYGAVNLAVSGVYSEFPPPSIIPTACFPPGYALFLAPFVKLNLGTDGAIAAQILLGAAAAVLGFELVRTLWNRPAGIVSGILSAIAPYSLVLPRQIASETLFVFLLAAAALLTYRGIRAQRGYWVAAGGLAVGCAALIRPIGLGLVATWAVAVIVLTGKRRLLALGVILIALVPQLLWGAHNLILFGDPLLGGVNADVVLGHYTAAWAASRAKGISIQAARKEIGQLNINPSRTELAAFRYKSFTTLVRDPGWWLRGAVQGFPILTLGLEMYAPGITPPNQTTENSGIRDLLVSGDVQTALRRFSEQRWSVLPDGGKVFFAYSIVYALLTTLLAVLSVIPLARRAPYRDRVFLLMLGIWILWLLIAPLPQTSARFRAPVEPLLAIFASVGAGYLFQWRPFTFATRVSLSR